MKAPVNIPHAVQLAWDLRREGTDAADTGLSVPKLVGAAIALADRDGLSGVSIRKLSRELGFTPMAVYRHVQSRDELLVLMFDVALGAPPNAITQASTWQQGVRLWGTELFARYQHHAWLLDTPPPGLPTTPNHIMWVESFLAVIGSTHLSLQQQLDAALLVDGHARYIAYLRRLGHQAGADDDRAQPSSWLRSLINHTTHPNFSAVVNEGVLNDATGPDFAFGLDCIIDGLAMRVPA
ncbi:MAG TPA: helix-turn-helix domain-containing protein [Thermomicrobiaceae bacterium]|nr:helix-turn-helix domain-containing protein [Thermomicrobiaceae bacterium]